MRWQREWMPARRRSTTGNKLFVVKSIQDQERQRGRKKGMMKGNKRTDELGEDSLRKGMSLRVKR